MHVELFFTIEVWIPGLTALFAYVSAQLELQQKQQ